METPAKRALIEAFETYLTQLQSRKILLQDELKLVERMLDDMENIRLMLTGDYV